MNESHYNEMLNESQQNKIINQIKQLKQNFHNQLGNIKW